MTNWPVVRIEVEKRDMYPELMELNSIRYWLLLFLARINRI